MAFKYTEDEYEKDKRFMTLEIRYDSEGNPTDSQGNRLGGIKPIPPHDPNKKPKIQKLPYKPKKK